ncbi:MAG: penicillin-binding protein [Acidipropionibacterium sp.]|jgi:cell division protein FtsI/penicillin-binding protein 2|nr:penicillin-binding protein [Acidipropionibacterium sp.]
MTPQGPILSRRALGRTTVGVIAATAAVSLAGCKGSGTDNPPVPDGANRVAQQLASGLTEGSLANVPLDDPATAAADLKTIFAGMDGLRPTVKVASTKVSADAGSGSGSTTSASSGDTVTATLNHTLPLAGKTWAFTSTARIVKSGDSWKVAWEPTIVHPRLTQATRLRHTRELGERASITGPGDSDIVVNHTVHDVGIDKTKIDKTKWDASATALAKLVQIDPKAYVKQVQSAGPQAFVVAITLREQDIPRNIGLIPGAAVTDRELPLAPTKTFAAGLLGTSGLADEDDVKRGKGAIAEGDVVGKSGLQLRYDDQLRGTVGHVIALVPRTDPGATASPQPDQSTQASTQPGQTPSSLSPSLPATLFSTPKSDGKPLKLTLDPTLQTKAETALAQASGVACLVAVQPSTGGILALANSQAAGANAFANTGQYAPGSTFKVATTLALLRAGLTPDSTVNCSPTVNVNGRIFHNYSDYDSAYSGNIPLTQAVAQSCNTAFISQHAKVTSATLRRAAGSVGVGVDYDAGFPAFYGSIADTTAADILASDMIGQGGVLASPMAMAGVAASVAAGTTVVPWLIQGRKPTPKAAPLSTSEVAGLRAVMIATVKQGSGRVLAGLATGAKTGTAEFGQTGKLKTHAWMICWTSQIAVACMVEVGESGSGTAGPIIKAFLS